jgi:hypothetical protein
VAGSQHVQVCAIDGLDVAGVAARLAVYHRDPRLCEPAQVGEFLLAELECLREGPDDAARDSRD